MPGRDNPNVLKLIVLDINTVDAVSFSCCTVNAEPDGQELQLDNLWNFSGNKTPWTFSFRRT